MKAIDKKHLTPDEVTMMMAETASKRTRNGRWYAAILAGRLHEQTGLDTASILAELLHTKKITLSDLPTTKNQIRRDKRHGGSNGA